MRALSVGNLQSTIDKLITLSCVRLSCGDDLAFGAAACTADVLGVVMTWRFEQWLVLMTSLKQQLVLMTS